MAQQHDNEGEVPLIPTDAEITLKKLLDKQLSTAIAGRLEQVDFQEATESMHTVGYGCSGVASRSEFLKNELAQKKLFEKSQCLRNALQEKGYSKDEVEDRCQKVSYAKDCGHSTYEKGKKRKGYGADPLFVSHSKMEELDIAVLQNKYSASILESSEKGFGRHAKELEASLLRGKHKLQAIAHLSGGGSSCRKPLSQNTHLDEVYVGMTPQDRARHVEASRTAVEVFSNRVPDLLDLHTYLKQRPKEQDIGALCMEDTVGLDVSSTVHSEARILSPLGDEVQGSLCINKMREVPEKEICCSRLSMDEIRQLPSGKFANYLPGNPSHVLYIKNLSGDVNETDLAALFLRYQAPGQQLFFRLMKRGRMKGQAFVTFPDEVTATRALHLINGYKLKGRPMIIEFGRGNQHV